MREPPLYRQVAERIVSELGPSLATGDRLPSERTLCERFEVSRVTLRSALSLLADTGVLNPAPARGWFVAAPLVTAGSASSPTGWLLGFTELAASMGQATSATVLRADVRPATLDEADSFSIVAGAPVFDLQRLRHLEGLVIAVDHSRVPLSLCPTVSDHDYATASLYHVLRSAPAAVHPSVADYAVEAVAATDRDVELLELEADIPLLVARQQTRDQHGRVCELGATRYRGDRFRFKARLGST